jgi:hypothetical protein
MGGVVEDYLSEKCCQVGPFWHLDSHSGRCYPIDVLWFGLRAKVDALEHRLAVFEASLEARTASLEDAAATYNRAAARAERAGVYQSTGERSDGDGGLAAFRRRRGL